MKLAAVVVLVALILFTSAVFAATTEITIDFPVTSGNSLLVEIVSYPANPTAGQSATLSAKATNNGQNTLRDVWLAWTLPSGWTMTIGIMNVSTSSLSVGSVLLNDITVTVGSSGGTITATGNSANATPSSDSETSTVGTTSPPPSPPPSGGTGGGGGGGGSAPVSPLNPPPGTQPLSDPRIGYTLPAELIAYTNQTITIPIIITNPSTPTLHNVNLEVSGLPAGSYSVLEASVPELKTFESATFSVFLNTTMMIPGMYTINWAVRSDEITETSSTPLEVQAATEQQANIQQSSSILKSIQFAFLAILVGGAFLAAVMLYFHFRNKCTLCGGELRKEYVGEYLVEYVCTKCAAKHVERK